MRKTLKKRLLPLLVAVLMLLPVLAGCSVAEELLNDEEFISAVDGALTEALSDTDGTETAEVSHPAEEESADTAGESAQDAEETSPVLEAVEESVLTSPDGEETLVAYGVAYSDMDSVALYIHLYGELPPNYLTKDEAKDLGWVSSKGNLWDVTDHMSIGGDYFGNYEGLLPKASGRKYYECDIDYNGGTRGAKRIIYSNDGLVYYTDDHYESFTLLYGEE